jgi:ketosteroid isomerase-like protein
MSQEIGAVRQAPAADVEEILRLSKEWWEANTDMDVERMLKVFPSPGDEFMMFNFNGHPYYSVDELAALWRWYAERIDLPIQIQVEILRVEVRGDTAWLACEGHIEPGADQGEWTADSVESPDFRATEIYHRDDGAGRPEWRMWHFHSSEMAARDETRMASDDSYDSRGLGWVPWKPLPESIG